MKHATPCKFLFFSSQLFCCIQGQNNHFQVVQTYPGPHVMAMQRKHGIIFYSSYERTDVSQERAIGLQRSTKIDRWTKNTHTRAHTLKNTQRLTCARAWRAQVSCMSLTFNYLPNGLTVVSLDIREKEKESKRAVVVEEIWRERGLQRRKKQETVTAQPVPPVLLSLLDCFPPSSLCVLFGWTQSHTFAFYL